MFEYINIDNWYTTFYGYWGEFPCGRVTLVKNYQESGEDLLFYVYQYSDLYDKFNETLNGSKTTFDDMIKALYWDLVLTSNDVDSDFDTWCDSENSVDWMLNRMNQKFNISIVIVGHDKRYSDMLEFQNRLQQKE